MKRIILTATISFLAWTGIWAAPELPKEHKVKVYQPTELRRDIIKMSELNQFVKSGTWGQNGDTKEFWNVWSDRSKNKTYNGPSESSGEYSELSFNQTLRIALIEKGYALVYEEPMKGMEYPIISQQAKCMGWIKMDNLLLWENCPTNDLGIYHKALIVANVEGWSKAGDKNYDKSYKNPITKDGQENVKTDMTFYFVMKEMGEYVLLARSSKMSKGTTDQHLYAWVSKNTYVPWDQRTCLEGNWDPKVADNLKGEKVGVYKGSKKGTEITLGRENGATTNPATKYRFPKKRLRFPLLNINDTKYELTAFATPDGKASEFQEDEAELDAASKADEVKEKLMEENNKINLIVVIDGTSSMGNYYKPMQDAIQKAYETFGHQNGITVKAGVVIYRDYADGKYMLETVPMTDPNDEKLKEFLSNGGEYGIKSSPKDRTAAEALYQGLNAALDAKAMGYNANNSNLMFVVGDCGNAVNDNRIDPQDIIDKCADLKINMVAFQVRNKDDASFNDFRRQMGTILRGNVKKQYKEALKWNVLSDGIVLGTIGNVKTTVMAALRNADKGEDMSPQKLNEIIRDNYIKFEDVIKKRIDVLNHAEDYLVKDFDQIKDAGEMAENSMALDFLKSSFTPQQQKIILQRGLVTAFNGNTAKKATNGQDYWKPVLFITGDEFASLMETLKTVYNGAKVGERKAYVNSLKKMIQTILPDITDEEMNHKDIKEVMDLVTGLIVKTKSLSNHTILEIQDEKIVSQSEFDGIISDFKQKYEHLDHIRSSSYEFSVQVQGVKWYWLPVDAMP
jgi:hypothetical protein